MKTRDVVLVAVVVVAVVIAGVWYFGSAGMSLYQTTTTSTATKTSTSTTTSTTTNTTTSTTTTSTTTSPPAGQTITLVARIIKFNGTNPTFTAVAGQPLTIHVVNSDAVPHNFIIEGVPGASTKQLSAGDSQTITVTFDQTGTYTYVCSIHPESMTGKIEVKGAA